MVFIKTQAGHQVMKDRSVPLTPRQRSAFIVIDGKHDLNEVLAATAAMGVTRDDILHLRDLGLLTELVKSPEPSITTTPTPLQADTQSLPAELTQAQHTSARSPQQRYHDAIPIATKLTAALGLRGFRLNLAVQSASDYDALVKVAARIRESVGSAKCAALDNALYD
jgi:hypothetical protein